MGERTRGRAARRRGGMTVLEVMVVLAILALLSGIAIPNILEWSRHQRLKDAARSMGDLLQIARSESIRTGRRHVVYFGPPGSTDPAGNPVEASGTWVPLLVLDDGEPTTSNCVIEGGEERRGLAPVDGLSWGVSVATARVPTDSGAGPFAPADGGTFADAGGSAMPWLFFGPDGLPAVFDGGGASCGAIGAAGTGGGALYLTDGERDYAIVLSPIGGVRLHLWNPGSGAWSS
jgi:prepilin-type N-terminal cleavage/methylation domain-containing protein